MKQTSLPVITEYLNYRHFLQDFYNAKKNENASYSYRVFANKADFGAPSHFKMVLDGTRNLTLNTIPKFQKALGFKKKQEAQFFELLVHYNQAKKPEEKIKYFNEIMELRRQKGLSLLEKHQFNLLSHWHYVAIYVLIDLHDFEDNHDWITKRLRKKVTHHQIDQAVESLKALNLIERDEFKGWRQTTGALTTDEDILHLSVKQYHKDMLTLALDSLREDPASVKEFNGVTLPINKAKLPVLKEKIRTFRKEINELASNMEELDQVYQLNIQLFPLSEVDT
jgi:uncharacterized protein (TIGR02147 family)